MTTREMLIGGLVMMLLGVWWTISIVSRGDTSTAPPTPQEQILYLKQELVIAHAENTLLKMQVISLKSDSAFWAFIEKEKERLNIK